MTIQQEAISSKEIEKEPVKLDDTDNHSEHSVGSDLKWTRRPFGGLCRDIRRRLIPYYKSDFTDAFTNGNAQQSTACILFLFFACLSPAITFGTIYEDETDGNLGVVEAMLSSAIAGVIYSLTCGQPLCILGGTGPNLAYTVAFYKICVMMDVDFLPARVWQGIWCSLFTIIFAITDSCSLMQYCTRYTEEIFSALISLIFIVGAFEKIVESFNKGNAAAGFLTACLAIGTYALAMRLRDVKKSKFMLPVLRFTVSNFAVTLAIISLSACARIWPNVPIEFLNTPDRVVPTYKVNGVPRPWLINPFGGQGLNPQGEVRELPTWAIFATLLPGVGMAVLNYLDQNLTSLLINRPTSAIKKPVGYHLDMMVLGCVIYPIVSILGLPFPCAATVRSLAHQIALTTYEDQEIPGGGTRRVAVKVIEQRVTHFSIHALIAFSVFMAPVLKFIPKGVLFGVFLYMGVTSMPGNQLFERMYLWSIWDVGAYPRFRYVTRVNISRLHLFTFIQVVMLAILYALKANKDTAVAFPFFIALLIFIRRWLRFIFTKAELKELDAHEDLPPDPLPKKEEQAEPKEIEVEI
eukprot:TRINITY_DN3275_c0_g1_i1.p1 TRINITY_DN3275_c0_g1~~TRINITY_DN3275_c0_g1_i1.p1  ORF type:complete len:578 (+),score=102.42 TRINITY_DN3275_c0_g1_i1:56-1789(+)